MKHDSQFFLFIILFLLFAGCSGTKKQQKLTYKKTNSGYTYAFHTNEKGKEPQVGDEVAYHQVVMKNDTLLQSTWYQQEPRKTILPPKDSVASPPPPHYEALLLMSPGDSLTIWQTLEGFQPAELPRGVSPQDTFIYHLKMFSIRPAAEVEKEKEALVARGKSLEGEIMPQRIQDYLAGKLDDQITTTESGLKYIIHEQGTGRKVESGNFLLVHYVGFLRDGTVFDKSYKKQYKPYSLRIDRGNVIKGWDEGLMNLNEGGSMTLFIPFELGYGVAGSPPEIPERSELIFHVVLEKIRF